MGVWALQVPPASDEKISRDETWLPTAKQCLHGSPGNKPEAARHALTNIPACTRSTQTDNISDVKCLLLSLLASRNLPEQICTGESFDQLAAAPCFIQVLAKKNSTAIWRPSACWRLSKWSEQRLECEKPTLKGERCWFWLEIYRQIIRNWERRKKTPVSCWCVSWLDVQWQQHSCHFQGPTAAPAPLRSTTDKLSFGKDRVQHHRLHRLLVLKTAAQNKRRKLNRTVRTAGASLTSLADMKL